MTDEADDKDEQNDSRSWYEWVFDAILELLSLF